MTRAARWFNARRGIALRSAGLAGAALILTTSLPSGQLDTGRAVTASTVTAAAGTGVGALTPAAATPVRLPPPQRADRATRPAAATTAVTAKPVKRTTTAAAATSRPARKTTTAKPAVQKKTTPAKSARTTTVQAPAGDAGRAETAVRFALAQVGKTYVWGSAGPGSYDCSGLVMAAFAKVGVKLAHQSGSIAGAGHAVSRAQLQRGDVIIYNGHVAIALGGGMMVHAANPRSGILVAKIYGSPIGYRRLT
jgi:cell wall-associated NlpC family hydrolase